MLSVRAAGRSSDFVLPIPPRERRKSFLNSPLASSAARRCGFAFRNKPQRPLFFLDAELYPASPRFFRLARRLPKGRPKAAALSAPSQGRLVVPSLIFPVRRKAQTTFYCRSTRLFTRDRTLPALIVSAESRLFIPDASGGNYVSVSERIPPGRASMTPIPRVQNALNSPPAVSPPDGGSSPPLTESLGVLGLDGAVGADL